MQREQTLFFHDSEAVEKKNFGEIEGKLSMDGNTGVAANSTVQLLDDKGNIVQSVQSTSQGNYRFKSVFGGKYKVRAVKQGWASQEAPVTATPAAAPVKADIKL